ncbi:MAG: hypothetical protein LBP79_06140 [Clostridiales bacterium]|jgi:N-glycosylase/DNA lyase|nr:hypothetical protein [Clostridiales bacterium]
MLTYGKIDGGLAVYGGGFDIKKTALSGQIFRYFEKDGGYLILSGENAAECVECGATALGITECGVQFEKSGNVDVQFGKADGKENIGGGQAVKDGGVSDGSKKILKIITKNADYFINYFDLNKNYDIINARYADNPSISAALRYSEGIRLLKQDRFETVISFIISANNNIPRIRAIIERLCAAAGRDCGGYRAFPDADGMKDLSEDFYKRIGAGYRAEYLVKTVRAVNDGFDLAELSGMSTEDAHRRLMRLSGVGPKVADCILLFAYGKGDVFPVDTWIKKSAREYFGIDCDGDIKKIRRELIGLFSLDSGIIQQYVYYYARNNPS